MVNSGRSLGQLKGIVDRVSDVSAYCAVGLICVLSLLFAVGALARYLLNRPLIFQDEMAGYLMIAITFLALSWTARTGGNIRVELVLEFLPRRVRRALISIGVALAAGWALVLIISGWLQTNYYHNFDVHSNTTLMAPLWIPASLIFVGSLLLFVQLVMMLLTRTE